MFIDFKEFFLILNSSIPRSKLSLDLRHRLPIFISGMIFKQFSESSTKVSRAPSFFTTCSVCLPFCHTSPYKNFNFQIDSASRCSRQLVYVLILVCSFQWCVLFLCGHIGDKGLFPISLSHSSYLINSTTNTFFSLLFLVV